MNDLFASPAARQRADTTQVVTEGDCLTVMRTMPTGSVACIVTSPPYNLGKAYSLHNDDMPEDAYLAWQGEVAREIARLLKPDGHLLLNVGADSKHPWRAMDVANSYRPHLVLQQTIAWAKSIALNASTLPERALREAMHERTFGHFVSINSPAYLNPTWESVFHFTPSGHSPINRLAIGVPYVFKDQPARFGHGRDKHCRGNAWHIPYQTTQSRADRDHHPATFPVELAAFCLRLADPRPDELVLDPFVGTGTTLLAAQSLSLRAIGIDIDAAYCAAARRRLSET
jgi:site-specific DNA-methyltransferase (adenine-specific)